MAMRQFVKKHRRKAMIAFAFADLCGFGVSAGYAGKYVQQPVKITLEQRNAITRSHAGMAARASGCYPATEVARLAVS
jgi:hypothetical protein